MPSKDKNKDNITPMKAPVRRNNNVLLKMLGKGQAAKVAKQLIDRDKKIKEL